MATAKNTFDFTGSISVLKGVSLRDREYLREMTFIMYQLGLGEGREKVGVTGHLFQEPVGTRLDLSLSLFLSVSPSLSPLCVLRGGA